ncbi:uncharacterized protein LOC111245781 [Varroa destructor]|uniref:Uncharacterized protein n=1 Tax=Varroa destructor TaxID=109461 RepID=A0A7M7JHA9_VARDE|nr:uncharacterized protein LOC111245781 [Varroa destructor]
MGERERARQIDIEFTLFLEPKEYLNAKEIPSAQIVFHHPEIIPDPQDNGIPIRSGYAHTFTLRHLVTRRLKHPYWTDCRDYEIVKRDRYIMQMTKSVRDHQPLKLMTIRMIKSHRSHSAVYNIMCAKKTRAERLLAISIDRR